MNIFKIFTIGATICLSACGGEVGESNFTDRPKIVSETNMFDRVFTLEGTKVWERRWNGATWDWLEHSALNLELASLSTNDLALGPMICNPSIEVCRLYVHRSQQLSQLTDSGLIRRPRSSWLMYTFNLNDTDYSTFSNNIGSFQPIVTSHINCDSNLSFDADFNMYCTRTIENNSGQFWVNLQKHDLDLNFLEVSNSNGVKPINVGNIDLSMRPCIMSESDIFFASNNVLHHVNSNMQFSTHSPWTKTAIDVSQRYDNQCQTWAKSKKLRGRRFSQNANSWQWDDNGRPISKSKIKGFGKGSMRSTSDGRLYVLLKPKSSSTKVFERYNDNGTWRWVGHTIPNSEVISEIGWVKNGSFFVTTKSGNLYQNNWRSDLNRWAWENHGQP